MNPVESIKQAATTLEPKDLEAKIVRDLDVTSPLIGADGPPDHRGPEEPYIAAFEDVDEAIRSRLARPARQ